MKKLTACLFFLFFQSFSDAMPTKKRNASDLLEGPFPGSVRVYKVKDPSTDFQSCLAPSLVEDAADAASSTEIRTTELRRTARTKLSLLVAKRMRKLPQVEATAAIAAGFDVDDEDQEEFKSLYFVQTPHSLYAMPVRCSHLLDQRKLDCTFGFETRRNFTPLSLQREAFVDLQSTLCPSRSCRYPRSAPPQLEYGTVRAYLPKSQTITAKARRRLKVLQGQVDIGFGRSNVVVCEGIHVKQLPGLCDDLDRLSNVRKSAPSPKGQAVLVTDSGTLSSLETQFLTLIKSKEDRHRVKWWLSEFDTAEDEVGWKFSIFPTGKFPHAGPTVVLKTMREILDHACDDLEDAADIAALKNITVRKVKKTRGGSYEIGDAHKLFKKSLQARFRCTLVDGEGRVEYFFHQGRWYEIPFPYKIQEVFTAIEHVDLNITFDPTVDIVKKKFKRGVVNVLSESAFNFRVSRDSSHQLILGDRLMVPYDFSGWRNAGKTFEPFDLIDFKNKLLITVKQGTAGGDVSHLVWQANNAAEALLNPRLREWAKHYMLLCDALCSFYGTEKEEDFFGTKSAVDVPEHIISGRRKGGSLNSFSTWLIQHAYGSKTTLPTTPFLGKIKDLLVDKNLDEDDVDEVLSASRKKVDAFFSGFNPTKVKVVLAFVRDGAAEISSWSVQELISSGLRRIQGLGYKVAISYINKK